MLKIGLNSDWLKRNKWFKLFQTDITEFWWYHIWGIITFISKCFGAVKIYMTIIVEVDFLRVSWYRPGNNDCYVMHSLKIRSDSLSALFLFLPNISLKAESEKRFILLQNELLNLEPFSHKFSQNAQYLTQSHVIRSWICKEYWFPWWFYHTYMNYTV